ncbi:unnamed protein product [Brassica rapa]|uniref:Uncharacterized protein n=2 Tax=Brassica TaxID=3705 RepID=A0A3P6AFJ5_BRACM|nr:unnamed protein product [Brassica napus]CAG7884883.1 unnamed protein product [Brassica rapa]CDY13461.1 BnaA03g51790D [Brassica napus]VDC83930.1 unnamed protein product [Brassica rapa]
MFDAFASLACSLLYLSDSGSDSFRSVHVFFFNCVPILSLLCSSSLQIKVIDTISLL